MEVINFEDKTWQEIPEQDNPAMHYTKYKGVHERPEECIMIFKGRHKFITNGGIVVAHVPISGDIIKKGVFWTIENAVIFADQLSTSLDNKGLRNEMDRY